MIMAARRALFFMLIIFILNGVETASMKAFADWQPEFTAKSSASLNANIVAVLNPTHDIYHCSVNDLLRRIRSSCGRMVAKKQRWAGLSDISACETDLAA